MAKTRIVAWLDVEQNQIPSGNAKISVKLTDGSTATGFICATCPEDLAQLIAVKSARERQIGAAVITLARSLGGARC
jgi:hypothetical protein